MTHIRISALLWLAAVLLHPCRAAAQREETFDEGIVHIAESFAPALNGKTVAVFEFPDLEGRVSNLSRLISEQLTTELVQRMASQGTVVERRQVRQVMAELNLQKTDLTAAEVAQVGRQLGADAIVLGSTTVLGNQIMVNARAVTVTGGRVVAASRMNVSGTPEMLALASSGLDAPTLAPRPSTAASTSARTPAQPAPPPPPQPVEQRANVGAVTLVLKGCKSRGGALECELTVTGTEDERISISHMDVFNDRPSRIIDPAGVLHTVDNISIGGRGEGADLVAGVPVSAAIRWEQVPDMRAIPLIELMVWYRENWSTVRFRDVPVR